LSKDPIQMQETRKIDGAESATHKTGLWGWIDRRTGVDGVLRSALYEPIPGGARFAYIFGSGLLFIFISQVITGVFLALYYVPSADHAHTTVAYITKAVTAGSFLRSLHAYGASAMVIVLLLHLSQTYIYGAYKGPREILWVSGCVLFALVLGMAFIGYLLPWDQRAYFATAVGTNAASEVPLIGETLKRMMRGGTEMGTLTISRFFVAHVFLIPAGIFALVASHIFMFRKAGAAGPVDEDPSEPKKKNRAFLSAPGADGSVAHRVADYWTWVIVLFCADTVGTGGESRGCAIYSAAGVVLPADFPVAEVLARSRFGGGDFVDPHDSGGGHCGSSLFRLQHRTAAVEAANRHGSVRFRIAGAGGTCTAQQEYMHKPFEAELSSASLTAANTALADPEAAKGKTIFESSSCNACHGDGGVGTAAAPALVGVSAKVSPEQLANLFKHPTAKMTAGGMPPIDLPPDDLKALIAYVESLK
jgi:ubiquinol-cytochrome c reductase cytochrome b subunit